MGDETPGQPGGPEPGPVHYQISITGRQAGAFFLMLLLALGLSFFFGMKTGAAARKGPDAVTRIAGASDLPTALPPDESAAKSERGDKAEPAPTATPEPSEKKLGFEDRAPAVSAPTATPEPAPTPHPSAVPTKTAAKAEPTAKPAEKPSTKPTAKAAEKTADKTAPKPAEKATPAPAKGWFVQVFATKDGKKADELVKKLKKEGFKADVAPSPKAADLFVVRVGPYPDKAKGEAARKKILKSNPSLKGSMVVAS